MARNAKIIGDDLGGATIDTTTNATIYSKPFSMQLGTVGSLHFIWTGTPTSEITFWESNKGEKPSLADDTDWVQNTDITFTQPTANASKGFYNFGNSGARWMRLKVVTTVSSGTFTCWANYAKLD